MKFKLSIKGKILIFILSTTVLIFTITVGYISYKNHQFALKNAGELAKQVTSKNALLVEKSLSENLAVIKTLASAFSVYQSMPEETWKKLFIDMYYKVYAQNPDFYKLWDSWELSFFDSTWQHNYGRYAVTVFGIDNKLTHSTSIRSMDGDAGMYAKIKTLATDMLWEPYWDEFIEEGETKKFMTSISSAVKVNGEYAGLVAADIIMDRFQNIVASIKPYNNSSAFLVSNNGTFVGHNDKSFIGKTILEYSVGLNNKFNLAMHIKKGNLQVFNGNYENGEDFILAIAPIKVGELDAPWSLGLFIPTHEILKDAKQTLLITGIVSIIGLISLAFIVVFISGRISSSIKRTTKTLEILSLGNIENSNNVIIKSGDEIESMTQSVSTLIKGLIKTSQFAKQIGDKDFDSDFKPLSENDTLGNALLQMRDNLKQANEQENLRKIDEKKRSWTTEGLAKFGDILRNHSSGIENLSFEFMRNLVNYLKANQGALFVVDNANDDEIVFKASSAIAYDRKKILKNTISLGEGLIGRCGFEKQTIHLTDVPQNYINITSGLGTANPGSILLVPLLFDEEICGVIELASFTPFDEHEISFVEKLSESIASTISTVKTNQKTQDLLEQSKLQADELSAQEEEMRQNMEELHATQEEAARREYEMEGIISALGENAYTVEYDLKGNIISANEKYADLLQIPLNKIIGTKHSDGYVTSKSRDEYSQFWDAIIRGVSKTEVNQIKIGQKIIWLNEIYAPILNKDDGKASKILKIAFDITEQKEKEKELMDIADKFNAIKSANS